MSSNKFHLECRSCNHIIDDLGIWFKHFQECPSCGNKWVDVKYSRDISEVKKLIEVEDNDAKSLFNYFDFLPLNNKENIITDGEGVIPVERWSFLEEFAKKFYNKDLKVNVYRNDLNPGTGTFKDVAASVSASALKEHGIKQYVVASTGNIASAFSHYLAKAGINLAVFVPENALKANVAEVSAHGQKIFRVKGDYAMAKKVAADYAKKNGILMSGGNTDPLRVEAKKTMVFEWLRQCGELPDVYIQALSGGTGPIAIDKAVKDIKGIYNVKSPRYIMVQPSGCDPMTQGWEKAKSLNFPEGWLQDYPIFENPKTEIPTLATGNPATYPIIATLVKDSDGEIITFDESLMKDIARIAAFEMGIKIGPASTAALGGFFEALNKGILRDGESVLINIGEGMNRAPQLVEQMVYTSELVSSADECKVPNREDYRGKIWRNIVPELVH
ncbi:MAG: pyridoxal-phosphate dependent enzyme [Bacteroidota bacterium]